MTSRERAGSYPGLLPVAAVAGRVDLWTVGARVLVGHMRRRWWARAPFLPVPDPEHLAWRRATLYGDPDHPISAEDLVGYLEWCRRQRAAWR